MQSRGFGPFLQFFAHIFAHNCCRLSFLPPLFGRIFGKRKKGAFQACVGHGGVGLGQKKLFNVDCRRVKDFLLILSWPARISNHFGSYFQPHFQGFSPEPSKGWNRGKPRPQMDSAPSNRGLPCCQPLGPTFVDPKAPLPGPAVGVPSRP